MTDSPTMLWIVALVAAYLFGSVPFSYLVVRRLLGTDVRSVGSGNAGATNVLRAAGKGPALLVLALDIAKGVAAVLLPGLLGADPALAACAAVAAVLGHIYPVFLGFKGGKGVATAAGALGALAPVAVLGALALFIAVVAVTRWVSLGSILAAVAVAPIAWALDRLGWIDVGSIWPIVAAAVVGGIVVFKHRANLGRLLRGEEPRIGQSKAAGEEGS